MPYVPANKHDYTTTPASILKEEGFQFTDTDMEKLILIASDFSQLAQGHYEPLSHLDWTAIYKKLLRNRQLTKGNIVNQTELFEGFSTFWGKRVLMALSSSVSRGEEHSWLTAMARKHRKNVHPVRHLLLYRYLGGENAPLTDLFKRPAVSDLPKTSAAAKKLCLPADAKDREPWLSLQKEHLDLFAKQLRQLESALYARLYRQDQRVAAG
ncbi:TnsD family Tn7-like transposition protein [Endozoicomonas acroporae]|uniref:TnsD family Tn7-like transposition protein n=1 Tax=Endozoicomonas acroporae TaxID=1701104 RepID=UPI0013D0F6BD|nr:TnsD family Tn7-like transposition protein [Endozoicomonas acroporae]